MDKCRFGWRWRFLHALSITLVDDWEQIDQNPDDKKRKEKMGVLTVLLIAIFGIRDIRHALEM